MSVPAPVPRERDDDDLLTPAEVAAIFRVDPKTVTRWAAARPPRLASIRTPGGHRRFRWSVVKARLLQDQQDQASQKLSRKPVINHCALPGEGAMFYLRPTRRPTSPARGTRFLESRGQTSGQDREA